MVSAIEGKGGCSAPSPLVVVGDRRRLLRRASARGDGVTNPAGAWQGGEAPPVSMERSPPDSMIVEGGAFKRSPSSLLVSVINRWLMGGPGFGAGRCVKLPLVFLALAGGKMPPLPVGRPPPASMIDIAGRAFDRYSPSPLAFVFIRWLLVMGGGGFGAGRRVELPLVFLALALRFLFVVIAG